jgi:hypothetical protein
METTRRITARVEGFGEIVCLIRANDTEVAKLVNILNLGVHTSSTSIEIKTLKE